MKLKKVLSLLLVVVMLVCNMIPVYADTTVETTELTFTPVDFDSNLWGYACNGKETMTIISDENAVYQLQYSKDSITFETLDFVLDEYLTFEVSDDVMADYVGIEYFKGYYYILAVESKLYDEEDPVFEPFRSTILRTDGKNMTSFEGPSFNANSVEFAQYPYFQVLENHLMIISDFSVLVTDVENPTGVVNYHGEYYGTEDGQNWSTYRTPELQLTPEEAASHTFYYGGSNLDGLVFYHVGLDDNYNLDYIDTFYTETFDYYVSVEGVVDKDGFAGYSFTKMGDHLFACIKYIYDSETFLPVGVEVWLSESMDSGWQKNFSKTEEVLVGSAYWSNDVLCLMTNNSKGTMDVNCWNAQGGMEAKEVPIIMDEVYNIMPYTRLNIEEGETDGCLAIVNGNEIYYSNDMWSTYKKSNLPDEFMYDIISLEETVMIGGENGYYSLDCYEIGETVPAEYTPTLGDVNENGDIEAADALTTLKAVVKLIELTDTQAQVADVDGNGEVSAEDALYILQMVVKLIDKFPAEK